MESKKEVVVFGGGCFWCSEAIFERLKGVFNVTSGYAGGDKATASYEKVSAEPVLLQQSFSRCLA